MRRRVHDGQEQRAEFRLSCWTAVRGSGSHSVLSMLDRMKASASVRSASPGHRDNVAESEECERAMMARRVTTLRTLVHAAIKCASRALFPQTLVVAQTPSAAAPGKYILFETGPGLERFARIRRRRSRRSTRAGSISPWVRALRRAVSTLDVRRSVSLTGRNASAI